MKKLLIIFILCLIPKFSYAAVEENHPRIWLTPVYLTELRARAAANSTEWVALQTWCDEHLDDAGFDGEDINWKGYRGTGYSDYIISYALAYQMLAVSDPVTADTYATYALQIMDNIASGFAVGNDPASGLVCIRAGEEFDRTVNIDEAAALGITLGTYKKGYPARNFGQAVAVGYDWLYDKLTALQKTTFTEMLYRWIDWYRGERTAYNNGVLIDGTRYFEDPIEGEDPPGENSNMNDDGIGFAYNIVPNNFFSGYAIMTGLAVYAVYGDNEDDDTYLTVWTDLWNDVIKPALESNIELKGGDSPEGWNYASGYFRIIATLEAMRTASDENPFDDFIFPKEFFNAYLHATKSNLRDIYVHGNWTGSYKGRPYEYITLQLPELFRQLYPTESIGDYAQYYINNVDFASFSNKWFKMLWYDSNADEEFFSSEPLYYRSIGTGLVTMRSTWTDAADSVWASIQLDNKYQTSHEDYDEGHFTMQRGDDNLITDGSYYTVYGANSISFGEKNQHTGLGDEIAINSIENTDEYLWVSADIAKAYQRAGYDDRATKFIRKFVYIKPNFFVIFDDTTAGVGYEDKQWMINFQDEPTLDAPTGMMTATTGSSKVFVKTLTPEPGNYSIDKNYHDEWKGEAWRVDITPDVEELNNTFLHAIYVADSGVGSMPSTSKIDSTTGGMTGVHIEDTDNLVVLFSEASGVAVAPVNYSYAPTADCNHYLFNMSISTKFDVSTVPSEPSGTNTVTVDESGTGEYTSTEEGVLSFETEEAEAESGESYIYGASFYNATIN